MTLRLYVHPFSSYCWKVLIPLYADGTPFEYRNIEDGDNMAELAARWPLRQFPVLVDGDETVQQAGQRIFDLFLKIASGEKTKSEALGFGDNEFVPWQIGAVM